MHSNQRCRELPKLAPRFKVKSCKKLKKTTGPKVSHRGTLQSRKQETLKTQIRKFFLGKKDHSARTHEGRPFRLTKRLLQTKNVEIRMRAPIGGHKVTFNKKWQTAEKNQRVLHLYIFPKKTLSIPKFERTIAAQSRILLNDTRPVEQKRK